MRQYNPDIDKVYSPDDTPELYLSDQQIEEYLNHIALFEGEDELAVREVIKDIEILNRKEKFGEITSIESSEKIRLISNQFLYNFGFWPYLTKTHSAFYQLFIK